MLHGEQQRRQKYQRTGQRLEIKKQKSSASSADWICHKVFSKDRTSNQTPSDTALQIKSQRDDEGQANCRAAISSKSSLIVR